MQAGIRRFRIALQSVLIGGTLQIVNETREELIMRNILVTVMMLIVVALLFTNIVNNSGTGLRANIQSKGSTANSDITALQP